MMLRVDFNKALSEGEAETCRGRLLLLGRGGVGKTSVKNALLGLDFSPEHDVTDLLDIQHASIDDGGTWQHLDESAVRRYNEHYLVALAVTQEKQRTDSKGREPPAAEVNQEEGATAGNERLGNQGGLRLSEDHSHEPPADGPPRTEHYGAEPTHSVKKQEVPADGPPRTEQDGAEPTHSVKKQEKVPAEVESLLQEGNKLEKKDSMDVWDFAGQLIYYTVHQLFLTERTIIVLVTDGSNDLEAPIPPKYAQESDFSLKTEKDYVEYFLKTGSIWGRSEGGDSGARRPCRLPHGFILLNKADLVSPEKLARRLEWVRKLVRETPAYDDMVRDVLPFTCKPHPGLLKRMKRFFKRVGKPAKATPELAHVLTSYEESRSKLKDCIQQVKQDFKVKLPIKWLRLRNKLQQKPYSKFQDAVKIAQSLQIEVNTVKSVLQYFHQHRELVYWDTEGCRDFIVCQPNWLINEMRKVISVKEYQPERHERQGSPELPRLLDILNNDKILSESLAKALWKENHEVMIEIMKKYFLLLPWTKDQFGRQQYLVPCLLDAMEDTEPIPHRQAIPSIYFYLRDKVIPIGLTSRLVTLLATTKGWNDGDKLPTICFNGAQFILKEKNTHISITLMEKLWKPHVGEEWKEKRERMKEQTVIQVRAGLTTEINEVVMRDTHQCLTRARETIEAGISYILDMINVSQPVVTAEESPCKHKLLPQEARVCNICHKSYGPEVYGAWFGQELAPQKRDTNHDFVCDADELKRLLDEVKPYLLSHMVIDPSLIAHLQVYHRLDDRTEQKLDMEQSINYDKVDVLMKHVSRDPRRRLPPLLLALKATCQTRVIEELDTEGIRRCLNLKHEESSLLDNLPSLKEAMDSAKS